MLHSSFSQFGLKKISEFFFQSSINEALKTAVKIIFKKVRKKKQKTWLQSESNALKDKQRSEEFGVNCFKKITVEVEAEMD